MCIHYASPSSGDAYIDRLLNLSFELKFFMCRHVSIWGFRNRVCPYPEKRNRLSFVNISPTLVIDASMERSSRVLQHGNPKIWNFFPKSSKLNFDLCWRAEIIQVGLTYMSTSGMHRRPFEGRHLVFSRIIVFKQHVW